MSKSHWSMIVVVMTLMNSFGQDTKDFIVQHKATYKKAVEAQLPPPSKWLMLDIGMPRDEASKYEPQGVTIHLVEGWENQVAADYRRANTFLAELPPQYRKNFLRLIVQWIGPQSLWRDDVATALGLTDVQRQQVERLSLERIRGASHSHAANGTDDVRVYPDEKEFIRLLTQDQMSKWNVLTNPPSKAIAMTKVATQHADDETAEWVNKLVELTGEIEREHEPNKGADRTGEPPGVSPVGHP